MRTALEIYETIINDPLLKMLNNELFRFCNNEIPKYIIENGQLQKTISDKEKFILNEIENRIKYLKTI